MFSKLIFGIFNTNFTEISKKYHEIYQKQWQIWVLTEDILQSNLNQGIVYPHDPTGILVNSLTPLSPLSARNSWKTPFKLTNFGYSSSNLDWTQTWSCFLLPKQILFRPSFAYVKTSNPAVVGVFLEGSARQHNVAVHVCFGLQNDFELFGLEGNIRPPAYCGNCFL